MSQSLVSRTHCIILVQCHYINSFPFFGEKRVIMTKVRDEEYSTLGDIVAISIPLVALGTLPPRTINSFPLVFRSAQTGYAIKSPCADNILTLDHDRHGEPHSRPCDRRAEIGIATSVVQGMGQGPITRAIFDTRRAPRARRTRIEWEIHYMVRASLFET